MHIRVQTGEHSVFHMIDTRLNLREIISQAESADIQDLRNFLLSEGEKPLVATGSGGAESVADFAALLYGAIGGIGTAVSPYTLNSYSDEALKTAKLLLVSAGGHNNDIVFAAKRGLSTNPKSTASLTLNQSESNEVRKLFQKAGSDLSLDIPGTKTHDGFVSTGTPIKFFALLCRAINPGKSLDRYSEIPDDSFRVELNDGTPFSLKDLNGVGNFVILHGSWGRPVADNLEGKLVESGHATACVTDFRNFCHGRFIYTSNHLEDSAVVMLVSPREKDIAERTRKFLPAKTKLVIIETEEDAPEASLDLLVRSTGFFFGLCDSVGVNFESPSNPGKIDKRVPMWVPFISEMKKNGPLTIR